MNIVGKIPPQFGGDALFAFPPQSPFCPPQRFWRICMSPPVSQDLGGTKSLSPPTFCPSPPKILSVPPKILPKSLSPPKLGGTKIQNFRKFGGGFCVNFPPQLGGLGGSVPPQILGFLAFPPKFGGVKNVRFWKKFGKSGNYVAKWWGIASKSSKIAFFGRRLRRAVEKRLF